MTQPSDAVASMAVAQVQAITENADRLGLTWTLRLGTVSAVVPSLTVTMDGDTVPIGMFSMVGGLTPGVRVYVITVPPSGNYVVGFAIEREPTSFVFSAAGSGAIGAETVVLTLPSATYLNGVAYELIFHGDTTGSIANNTAAYTWRRNNVGGTILSNQLARQMSATVGVSSTVDPRVLILNASGADITDTIVLTLQSIGGGTVTMAGGFGRYAEARPVGSAAIYAGAPQL